MNRLFEISLEGRTPVSGARISNGTMIPFRTKKSKTYGSPKKLASTSEYRDRFQGVKFVCAGSSKKDKNMTIGALYDPLAARNRPKTDTFKGKKSNASQVLKFDSVEKFVWISESKSCYKGFSPNISNNPGIFADRTKIFHDTCRV